MRGIVSIVMAIFVLFAFSGARAQSASGPPLAGQYPLPDCQKPEMKLIMPESERSGNMWMPNNARIEKFNKEANAFDSCMHRYIDNANSEVKKIQDKANNDLKQITDNANAAMKEIQDKIRQAVNDANEVALAQEKSLAEAKPSR